MSARGPFATTKPEDDNGNPVVIGGVEFFCGSARSAREYANKINAAHADRVAAELEAAADAIMEKTEYPCCEATLENAVDIVRARAKAIREGGAP